MTMDRYWRRHAGLWPMVGETLDFTFSQYYTTEKWFDCIKTLIQYHMSTI